MDRVELGQQNIGMPQMEAIEEVIDLIDKKNWDDFERPIALYYLEGMIGNHLLSLIDSSLDDDQLKSIEANEVRFINLILLRDHFRHNADVLRKTDDKTWIDEVFDPIFSKFGIAESRYKKYSNKFELNDISDIQWARELAQPFGLPAEKLFVCHSAIVTGVKEELIIKPWWKFW